MHAHELEQRAEVNILPVFTHSSDARKDATLQGMRNIGQIFRVTSFVLLRLKG
jgi:hypothetical protein